MSNLDNTIGIYRNGVSIKIPNRRITINKKEEGKYCHEICVANADPETIKSIKQNTPDKGKKLARGKVNVNLLSFSSEGIEALYYALHEYIKQGWLNKISENKEPKK